jgi:hypothetical protein
MSDVVLVPAKAEHAFVLSTTMREKDVAELARCGLSPLEACLQSLRVSEVSFAALYDDVVGALFGVEPLPRQGVLGDGADRLWLLTAHVLAERPMAFFRAARRTIQMLLVGYPVLRNVIDARHDDALRFARAMGARFAMAVPYGPMGEPFIPFEIRRH